MTIRNVALATKEINLIELKHAQAMIHVYREQDICSSTLFKIEMADSFCIYCCIMDCKKLCL